MLRLLIGVFLDLFRSQASREAEIVTLRHQVPVHRRRLGRRKLRLTWADRAPAPPRFPPLVGLARSPLHRPARDRCCAGTDRASTLTGVGRAGRGVADLPPIPSEVRELMARMHRENPLWGASRIHDELLMFGIQISESTVSHYLTTLPRRRPNRGWRTFLRNHVHESIAVDFVIVPTIRFKLLFVFVVLDLARRRILQLGGPAHPTAQWTGQRLAEALP